MVSRMTSNEVNCKDLIHTYTEYIHIPRIPEVSYPFRSIYKIFLSGDRTLLTDLFITGSGSEI